MLKELIDNPFEMVDAAAFSKAGVYCLKKLSTIFSHLDALDPGHLNKLFRCSRCDAKQVFEGIVVKDTERRNSFELCKFNS